MQLNTGFWQNVNIEYHFEEDDAEPEPSTSSKQKIIEGGFYTRVILDLTYMSDSTTDIYKKQTISIFT